MVLDFEPVFWVFLSVGVLAIVFGTIAYHVEDYFLSKGGDND